jgi:hypothetical protein
VRSGVVTRATVGARRHAGTRPLRAQQAPGLRSS